MTTKKSMAQQDREAAAALRCPVCGELPTAHRLVKIDGVMRDCPNAGRDEPAITCEPAASYATCQACHAANYTSAMWPDRPRVDRLYELSIAAYPGRAVTNLCAACLTKVGAAITEALGQRPRYTVEYRPEGFAPKQRRYELMRHNGHVGWFTYAESALRAALAIDADADVRFINCTDPRTEP